MTEKLKFNREFFRDFWQLLKPFWRSEEKWRALGLLSLNIACIIVLVRANVGINQTNNDFYEALQTYSKSGIYQSLKSFSFYFLLAIIAVGYNSYISGLVTIRWRQWLTRNYLAKWLHHHTHYRMKIYNNNVDNPDQRISEDLDLFAVSTLGLFFEVFNALLTVFSFAYILWNLSGSFSFSVSGHLITIPGYLLITALVYSILGTWITAKIGGRLPQLKYQQQLYNANFRFGLVRLREGSEQVALYRGESNELLRFDGFFSHIVNNFRSIITIQKRLNFFNSGYSRVTSIFSIVVSMPMYLAKKIQLGPVMQIAQAFQVVTDCFSLFLNSYSTLAEWRSVIARLAEFQRTMDNATELPTPHITVESQPQSAISIEDLTLSLPNGRTLLSHLNLAIEAEERVLITGPNGIGKSTLLRASAGIWPYGQGKIVLPCDKNLMYLPQKPYFPLGTLQEALTYPQNTSFEEGLIRETLQRCALEKLLPRIHETANWSHELSLGEQQLVAFARIFLVKPDIVFLDEATSALGEAIEQKILALLLEYLPKITLLSIGHRTTLKTFHTRVVELVSG